jgi:hypothetical protein
MKREIACFLISLLALQSCTIYTKTSMPIQQAVASGVPVKVVNDQNNVYTFKRIVFEDSTYYGVNGSKRTVLRENTIDKIYPKNRGASATATTTLLVVAAAGTFLVIACNCPHVYVNNGTDYELNTTLFTGAVATQLERHDYKILPDYQKDSEVYEIKIANEDNEDQYTNLLELITVNHNENESVLSDKNGNIVTVRNLVEPIEALDNSMHSIRDQVRAADTDAYRFDPDSISGLSEVFFTFGKPASADNAKLVLRVKNSNWSGYVYDEFNSLFGKRYAEWVKSNENKSKEEREKWMTDQGINLLVDIKTDGGWKNVDRVELVGEVSYHSIVIPLEFKEDNSNLEIRVRSGFKFWELDYAGVDFSEDSPVEIQRLKPVLATGSDGEDFTDALSSDDSKYMDHLGKGTSTLVRFEPMTLQKGKSRTIIIHSKGYYLHKKTYEGKTHTKELEKFRNAGELSRFSKRLYDELYRGITQNK